MSRHKRAEHLRGDCTVRAGMNWTFHALAIMQRSTRNTECELVFEANGRRSSLSCSSGAVPTVRGTTRSLR
jgi:hypothetical protein